MSSLWIPPKVDRELRESTEQHNQATLGMFDLHTPVCEKFNRELRRFDPLMRLGKARERVGHNTAGVFPGYYHLIRKVPNGPLWVVPLHDGNGGFAEPTGEMLQMLRESDQQNPQVIRAQEERKRKEEAAKDKAKLDKREEREGLMMEAWRVMDRPKVLYSDDVSWSNSTAGKRARRKKTDD